MYKFDVKDWERNLTNWPCSAILGGNSNFMCRLFFKILCQFILLQCTIFYMNGLWPMVPPDTCTSQSLDKSVPFFTNIYKKNWAWLVATLNAYVKHWQQFYILDKGSANTMQSSKKMSKVHVVNFLTYIRVYICYKQDR